MRTEDIRNMAKAYAAVLEKAKKEAMDPVNPSELKGKHKDRKDKDIDNDGDVDSTDQYLHKRRKAISKSKKETASKSATNVSKDNKTDTDVQTQEDTKEETIKTVIEGEMPPALKKALDKKKGKMNDDDDMDDEDEDEDDDDEKENGKKKKKEPVDEAGPKIDPAKMAAHMARNDKPKKMTSTQKSLASIRQRAEEVDLDESAAAAAAAKRKMDQDRRDRDRSPVAKLLSPRERSEAEARARRERQAAKREEVELDEISKDLAGRYIKKANINTADAADQNARKSSMGQKSSIGKVMKRFKGVGTAADKLTGKAKVPAREELKKGDWVVHGGGKVGQVHNVSGDKASVDVKWNKTGRISSHTHSSLKKMKEEVKLDEASKGTAQHKPDEKTRDTYEKQLKRSKGEKDFVDQHKAETPEAGDEPKVDALNFQKFKSMVSKKDNSRPADQKKGDNSIIPSATPVKQ